MPFVLDNSVVSGWFLRDQATAYTEAMAIRLQDDVAIVPALWELEFANVLRVGCVRQRMDAATAHAVASQVAKLPIEIDRHGVTPAELLGLSLRFGLSAYDAAYLELALRLRIPVATQDGALQAAALASGVGWVTA